MIFQVLLRSEVPYHMLIQLDLTEYNKDYFVKRENP
jgi:hypothetical protein